MDTNQLAEIQKEVLELFSKNKDYGDAFATYGPIGVIVRMGDKISRLQSIKIVLLWLMMKNKGYIN